MTAKDNAESSTRVPVVRKYLAPMLYMQTNRCQIVCRWQRSKVCHACSLEEWQATLKLSSWMRGEILMSQQDAIPEP